MTPGAKEVWSEFDLLKNLAKVNRGIGTSTQRMLEYQSEHGSLPVDELRELAWILGGLSSMISRFADRAEQPTIDM